MSDASETIYLIPGEDIDGQLGWLWCDDPAPTNDHDPAEAVKYVRADVHQAILDRQAKAALAGMDAAKHHALSAEQNAKRMLAESRPEVLESERAANAQLTQELEQVQARVAELENALSWALGKLSIEMPLTGGNISYIRAFEKADKALSSGGKAWLLRKQADAAEEAIVCALRTVGNVDPFEVNIHKFANDYAQRLRQQANEAERAGGEGDEH